MLRTPASLGKAYAYSLPSACYRAAFSTADTVRLFRFFTRPEVYPFWFFHLNRLFDDDLQIGYRMAKYVQDVLPVAGFEVGDDVAWQELVTELRSQTLQRYFTARCHHACFNTGTYQERLKARAASLLGMQALREQAYRQGETWLAHWFDQAIHAARGNTVTQQTAVMWHTVVS
jgi:hypothetical protein